MQATRLPESALYRLSAGEHAHWGIREQLLAAVFDQLRVLAWLQTEDGAKGRNRPNPLPRPGITPPENERHIEAVPQDLDDIKAWLAKRNPQQHTAA